jgi:hypothetical protein
MKNFIFVLFLFLFSSITFADEKANVTSTFNNYKIAILNDKGIAAYENVDNQTKQYYNQLREMAVFYNKSEIDKLGLLDKFQVIIMRHRIEKNKLINMSGKDLFIYAVNNGWVGKNGVSNLGIGTITINGNFAKAVVLSKGAPTPLNFHFYKDEQKWGLDIKEMTKLGEASFLKMLEKSGKSEYEFIFYLTHIVSKKPINRKTIFLPLKVKQVEQ